MDRKQWFTLVPHQQCKIEFVRGRACNGKHYLKLLQNNKDAMGYIGLQTDPTFIF